MTKLLNMPACACFREKKSIAAHVQAIIVDKTLVAETSIMVHPFISRPTDFWALTLNPILLSTVTAPLA